MGALRERPLRLLFAVAFCFAFGSTVLQSNLAVLLKDLLAFDPAANRRLMLSARTGNHRDD